VNLGQGRRRKCLRSLLSPHHLTHAKVQHFRILVAMIRVMKMKLTFTYCQGTYVVVAFCFSVYISLNSCFTHLFLTPEIRQVASSRLLNSKLNIESNNDRVCCALHLLLVLNFTFSRCHLFGNSISRLISILTVKHVTGTP
jgi:hypothetical protein